MEIQLSDKRKRLSKTFLSRKIKKKSEVIYTNKIYKIKSAKSAKYMKSPTFITFSQLST